MLLLRKGSVVENKSYYSIMKALRGYGEGWPTRPLLNTLVKMFGIVEPRVSKILVNYLCMKDADNAIRFLDVMKDKTHTTTFPAYFLRKLTQDGRALDAYKLIIGGEHNLPTLNVVDYSKVVDSLCKGGHMDKALDLCSFAKRKGITLSILTFNSVINGLCRQGCFIEAFRLFDSLEKIDLFPSDITYATLIDTLSKEGYLLDARKLFDSMVLKGLNPNTRVYNLLIDIYCKQGQIEEALKLLLELELRRLKPDEFTVCCLINGYCQKGDMEGALESFLEFKRKGLFPDFLGFMYLIRGLCAKGRMEECRTILTQMLQTQSVVELLKRAETQIGTESLGSFLVSLCDQGNVQEATVILNEVGSLFFSTARRVGSYDGSNKQKELCDGRDIGTVQSESLLSSRESGEKFGVTNLVELENIVKVDGNVEKQSLLLDFSSYYALIASLCSRGELWKANKLAKLVSDSERIR